ncbi:MAG: glycosyltransferase family 9 protein [Desulfobacca sp.]|nr:glycosyltransferase family 9 protein [Desulfobacca sp.]
MRALRILVMQLARLGDLVQTIPLLSRLRAIYPTARVNILTDRIGEPLLTGHPAVDEVIPIDLARLSHHLNQGSWMAYQQITGLVKSLQQQRYDLVLNINFSSLTRLLAYLLQVPQVLGYQPTADGRGVIRSPWLTYIYALVHARRFNRINLVDVFRHLAPASSFPELHQSLFGREDQPPWSTSEPRLIALQLGSRHSRRRWPVAFYASLSQRLIQEYDLRLLLLGIKDECPLGEALLRALPIAYRERVSNLQGRTSLAELRDWLSQVQLLVTGDTGTMHLAAYLGVPVLALFMGPALCFETGPYGNGHYVLQAEPDCHPCAEAKDSCDHAGCRQMIRPEMAAAVIDHLLAGNPLSLDSAAWPGVQLYRSEIDALGVNYRPQLARPWTFVNLVGQAYRQAGQKLLGIDGPGLPPNSWGYLPSGSRREMLFRKLETFQQVLRQGNSQTAGEPELREAMLPLAAFQQQLRRQAQWPSSLLPNSNADWDQYGAQVKDSLCSSLQGWLAQAKGMGK